MTKMTADEVRRLMPRNRQFADSWIEVSWEK